MEWYLKVLKNYVGFEGRARRKEYWLFFLINFVITVVLTIVEWVVGLPAILSTVYGLTVFLPALAVAVRRMHDIGKSGWWLLINLVPFVGAIIFFVFTLLDSKPGDNEYGANPKAA